MDARLQLLKRIGESLALHFAALRLRDELREQSIRDPLTGLYNRRYMQETLVHELSRAKRNQMTLSIAIMDVDHFKQFNDKFGHQAGDAVLQAVGNFLTKNVREEDIACRYGGEEFLVIFPQLGADQARERVEALRVGMSTLNMQHDSTALPNITISMGISFYPQHGNEAQTLIELADQALYRAKQNGRNRLEIATMAKRDR
jgi:diguanylate cyclase (GGDEF)-like protein